MSSYYNASMGFPYLSQGGIGDGAWSNGGDAIFSMPNYDYNGMFGGFGYPQFSWDFPGSEYWSNPGQTRKDSRDYNDYYRTDAMPPMEGYAMNGDMDRQAAMMKSMEQGLKGMSVNDKQDGSIPNDMVHLGNGDLGGPVSNSSQAPKKASWAAIASTPARPQPPVKTRTIPRAPVNPNKHMDIGTWDNKNNPGNKQMPVTVRPAWGPPRGRSGPYNGPQMGNSGGVNSGVPSGQPNANPVIAHPVLEKLISANQYNPKEFNLNPKGSRFFIIKSYSEDDIHRSIKYSIWCSTEHGNKRLDAAHREREGKGPIFLFFSVNGSGHFCGMAQMMSGVDYHTNSRVWAQDKWKGQIEVKWIYVKDVPNSQLRHIRLENNENKPVTNSRDTQEVPPEKGKQVLKILHNYRHTTSIFDDFSHYEKRQEEDVPPAPIPKAKVNAS